MIQMNGNDEEWHLKPLENSKPILRTSCENRFINDEYGNKFDPKNSRTEKQLSLEEVNKNFNYFFTENSLKNCYFDLGTFGFNSDYSKCIIKNNMRYNALNKMRMHLLEYIDKLVEDEIKILRNKLKKKFEKKMNIKIFDKKIDELNKTMEYKWKWH